MIILTKKVLFPTVILTALMALSLLPTYAQEVSSAISQDPIFFEAENFTTLDDGWRVQTNRIVRDASRITALSGSAGKADGVATQQVTILKAGDWRIWVRFMEYQRYEAGPFVVDVLQGQKAVATHDFHLAHTKARSKEFIWRSFDINLQPGQYTLQLRKYQNKNSNGYTRKVDCFLLTTDKTLKPSIVPYGPQTWMKVTLGDGYEKPVRLQAFADHFRAPYYASFQIGKGYFGKEGIPEKSQLSDGESTGWLNISETIYQDSGAMLRIKPSIGPRTQAETFNGTIQFATKPDDAAVVRTFKVNRSPSTITIVVPPNLESAANIAKLRSDIEIANEYGAIADNFDWSTVGKKPVKFPLLVTAAINPEEMGSNVVERELKTLSYFGFNGIGSDSFFEKYGYTHKKIDGIGWDTKNGYSDPDLAEIKSRADSVYAAQVEQGIKAKDIAFVMLRDEPTGEPLSKIVNDKASNDGLRAWIKRMNLTPADLLVNSWDDVKLVTDKEKKKFPALYYYSERYRTIALGNFIAAHKNAVLDNWKSNFSAVVNFSDGAISGANFYKQGVDYFTLLHDTDQNAIWGEDWGNFAATYQHTAYNVELMRSAARRKGQTLGQFLIVYYGRKGYDIRLKAVSEVARGVKVLNSFFYGPVWAGHTPSAWSKVTDIWKDHAELNHEIGAVEDDLLPAMPQKAEVAILYSSASDIWNQDNAIYGYERMNTWLALAHAQIPVDVVGESDVALNGLAEYKVCYLADPNITRAAAAKLAAWVKAGGTLIMTAGAGERDEFNRPLKTLNELLPYQRNAAETLESYRGAGYQLYRLNSQGVVSTSSGDIDVLSVKQTFANVKAQNGVSVKSTFKDDTPAAIQSSLGQGTVISMGYLPAVAYMRKALLAQSVVSDKREEIEDNNGIPSPDDEEMFSLETKSYNPWEYPAGIRESIVAPLKAAGVNPPIQCSVPLVDAVYMTGGKNLLIPLANYTLKPIKNMTLDITVQKPVLGVKSVEQGELKFQKIGDHKIRINIPLDCTDFVTVEY